MTLKMRLVLMWVFTLATGDPPGVWLPAFVGLLLLSGAYVSFRFAMQPQQAAL